MVFLHTSIPRLGPFSACKGKAGAVPPSPHARRPHRLWIRAGAPPGNIDKATSSGLDKAVRLAVAGTLASTLLWLSPSPAEADMQMVSPQMVTQMARPLPKQTVDKEKIWTVFIGGAVLLFGVTIVAENNETLFPAITRANRAFRDASRQIDMMEERQKKQEELLRLRQAQYDEEQRQLALVQQGMREARTKMLGTGDSQEASAAPAAAAALAEAQPVRAAEPESHTSDTSGSTDSSSSSSPYIVVDDAVPDMGAVAWPAASTAAERPGTGTSVCIEQTPAAAAVANGAARGEALPPGPSLGAPSADGEDMESVARLTRLQGFVSGTMSGNKSALEAYKAQRQ